MGLVCSFKGFWWFRVQGSRICLRRVQYRFGSGLFRAFKKALFGFQQ